MQETTYNGENTDPGSKFAARFELLRDRFRHPDGERWRPAQLMRATNGHVNESYLSAVRAGRIKSPGFVSLALIAKAMGFSLEYWDMEPDELREELSREQGQGGSAGTGISRRIALLFDTMTNPETSKGFTDTEVARASAGELLRDEVRDIRTGRITDPRLGQILAFAKVFDVNPSFLLSGDEEDAFVVDEKTKRALRDPKVALLVQKSAGLSDGEKDMILGMTEQLIRLRAAGAEQD